MKAETIDDFKIRIQQIKEQCDIDKVMDGINEIANQTQHGDYK